MKITAQLPLEIDTRYQQFLSLPPFQQWAFTVLAVIYKPISLGHLNKLLKQLTIQLDTEDTAPFERISSTILSNWRKQGFVNFNKGDIKLTYLLNNRLTQDAIANDVFLTILKAGEAVVPVLQLYDWEQTLEDEQRLIRDFYFLNDHRKVINLLKLHKNPQHIDYRRTRILIELAFVPFDLTHFLALPDTVQYQAFACWFYVLRQHGASNAYPLSLLEQVNRHQPEHVALSHLLAEQYLLQGRVDSVQHIVNANDKSCYGLQLNALNALLTGDLERAIGLFANALVAKNKYTRKKNQYLNGVYGIFYNIALLIQANRHDPCYFTSAEAHIFAQSHDKHNHDHSHYVGQFLLATTSSLSTATPYTSSLQEYAFLTEHHVFYAHLLTYLEALSIIWSDQIYSPCAKLVEAHTFFKVANYGLFATLIEQLGSIEGKREHTHPIMDFTTAIKHKVGWDLALEKLIALAPSSNTSSQHSAVKVTRLIWIMHITPYTVSFSAREQIQNASGWSKGKPIALQRLYESQQALAFLSEHDKQLCSHINRTEQWRTKTLYALEGLSALRAACAAPNLYIADDLFTPIELHEAEPELLITQQGEHLVLSIADIPTQQTNTQHSYSLIEHAPEQYRLTVFSPEHLKVTQIIGEEGLSIPVSAKDKVLAGVNAIAPLLNIQSDIAELDTGLETLPSHSDIIINIQPFNDGLAFNCVVMPFGEHGPTLKPGVGNAKMTTEIKGKRVATSRDLVKEQIYLDLLDQHCPAFLAMQDTRLQLDDLQCAFNALEQLEALSRLSPSPVPIELRWPKGKKMTMTKSLQSHHLQLAMTKKNQWFDLNGELSVDDSQVIELKTLLTLAAQAHGRFITLDDQQVLALSDELKQRLDKLNEATDGGQFHPLASQHVSQATTGMRMKTLHAWDEQHQKMHKANALIPSLPNTLQATLRDYQIEGFDWASRLAHWGAGACLADDMGLGKTLQALAVLLDRAKDGPSLVIAPTSVCFNWIQEACKFAPSINMILLADLKSSPERTAMLSALKPFDCVVVSYGLLQRESEMLQSLNWRTIVADEAQALKNPLAKRSVAACALKGDFKLITTGTPIENNLSELWSLFRFVNPGLLGNLKRFSARFSTPIEAIKDDPIAAKKARNKLKNLIKPFILRRMKHQVLTELPARTDINVKVQLSDEEMALYEALRQSAIDNLTQSSSQDQPGAHRIKMLAELIKLRQACCNPALVLGNNAIPSAKLAALDKLLDELQENNHKALIFSQFVGHLQLIKQHLDAKGVHYQYLDGSTPNKQRQQRVNAFQQGDGDVFLISLKAGGSGLNLTAADYVIHMDPWWNPAVEEQASDRAHRMGQQRPVTIYRLIASDTIEEKIVALHQHKRDLAQTLLSGNDQSNKLSVADMMAMLKQTF